MNIRRDEPHPESRIRSLLDLNDDLERRSWYYVRYYRSNIGHFTYCETRDPKPWKSTEPFTVSNRSYDRFTSPILRYHSKSLAAKCTSGNSINELFVRFIINVKPTNRIRALVRSCTRDCSFMRAYTRKSSPYNAHSHSLKRTALEI